MEKKFQVQEKQIIVFLVGALARIWKITEVDSGFKRHRQDKPMQEILETKEKICKVRTGKWYY